MRTADEVKARAANLRELLSGLGHTVKHGQCLDIVSKLEGYTDWNTHAARISANLSRAEQYVDEMLEGEAELSYAKFTRRYEKKFLMNFSDREFQRDMRNIREDYGDYISREFLGCLKGPTHPDVVANYPNQIRYVWRGVFDKNELLMIAGIYSKGATYYVSGFRYM